ncbi:hypothetical protein [Commensalibacter communis]|uniref:hypothetical protein n=1 Tax=Commensalibacter communis TaxID=2972786 RepID=UPI0022FF7E18|nr:hypothetical protein [Commensalibacter communis]CAI3925702.1 unnamed protein product [Commensalibacter communis]CAI3928975.1 unnamed protein product [Commensalibacter communis]
MIEIKGERELIQIDVTQSNTDKKKWQSGDNINCNIYFQKLECKFASKDIVITYDALENFNRGLKQMVNHDEGDCFLNDENRLISLKCVIDRDPFRSVIVTEGNIYKLEFNLLYHKGSDISLKGYLYSNKKQLQQTVQEINSLL